MKNFFSSSSIWQDGGLGLVRIITGAFLIFHGWETFDAVKMREYAGWDVLKSTGAPSFLAYLGKSSELVSGLLLTAGLLTRIACIILAGTMLFIAFFIGHGKIWYDDQHPFLFVLLAMVFFFTGGGKWSLDRLRAAALPMLCCIVFLLGGSSPASAQPPTGPSAQPLAQGLARLSTRPLVLQSGASLSPPSAPGLSSPSTQPLTQPLARPSALPLSQPPARGLTQPPARQLTYCNPMNLDYGYTPIPNFTEWGKHRATADPVIVNYKGDYYLFSTNQWGYWWSNDLLNWKFISRKFLRPWNQGYDELCAPAVGIIGDTMIVFGSTYTRNFTIWMSTDPKANQWKPLVDSFDIGGWDPAFFTDDDGKLYMYNGSSNSYPLYGIELDRKTFQPMGTRRELFLLHPDRFGWQRFGEYYDNTFLDPFIEGSWMTKHNGKYYLQYGAPGTEFSGYADGVVVGDGPLGPFDQPQSDPLSFHPGGFARGAGHGSTFMDNDNRYWHISTITIAVKNSFERRLGLWPAGFDKDGVMYMNSVFGDYPHYLPSGEFTGWMLLNYKKPVTVSSTLGNGHPANDAVDEDIKTYWSAATGDRGEWIQSDLGHLCTVHAIQINYADQDATFLGKQTDIYHQYRLYQSADGKKWTVLVDKSRNMTDIPHEYVELHTPVQTRYIRMENIHMPSGKFAISGLRVFGKGNGASPDTVKQLVVLRTEKDKRSAWIKWSPVDNAYAYNIYTGTAPDKLYTCIMVQDANEYYDKLMDKEKTYYFSIEAINENGVSARTSIIKVD